jgi:hypothetical protein
MKRGIEILIMWLVIAFFANMLVLPTIPPNGAQKLCFELTVISFPFAAWCYARHAARVSPVICFGLIAGVYSILPAFTDSRGMARDITLGWEFVIGGVPVLMTLVCVGLFALRRYLDRDDERHDV